MWLNGADISMLEEIENSNGKYYDTNNNRVDAIEYLPEIGFNLCRLRLWVNPYDEMGNAYGGGTNDLETTISLAKRIKANGMKFLLDIHYSDFWTDPRKQKLPKDWSNLSFEQLKDKVYSYTSEVLQILEKESVVPEMIQIGNEITNGFLWPHGQLPEYIANEPNQPGRDYQKFFELLSMGIKATREINKEIKIIMHVDFGGDNGLYRQWFDNATNYNLDYDIIGLSYYPFWHNSLSHLKDNLHDISKRYNKQVLVVETSYPHTTKQFKNGSSILNDELINIAGYSPSQQGQANFVSDLIGIIKSVPNNMGIGFVYWEPLWIPSKTTWATLVGQKYAEDFAPEGNSWADQAIFDYDGKGLEALIAVLK